MNDQQNLLNSAIGLHQSGRIQEALNLYEKILPWQKGDARFLFLIGTANLQIGQLEKGLKLMQSSLRIYPRNPLPHNSIGLALHSVRKLDEALASFDRALAIDRNFAPAHNNRGNVLRDLRRLDEAVASYDKALVINPGDAETHYNQGLALRDLKRLAEALASCDKALAIKPDFALAHNSRGNVLRDLNRSHDALASYDKAVAIKPDFAEAYCNRGTALRDLMRLDEALTSYDKALAISPDIAEGYYNRGNALQDLGHWAAALANFEKAMSIDPGHRYAFGGLANAALRLCDWKRTTSLASDVVAHIRNARVIIAPMTVLGYSDDASLQLECARSYVQDEISSPKQKLWNGTAYRHDKIRVAYLSSDFRRHATSYLAAELYECHDRSRFEVIGISVGEDDGSEIRARLVRAFDQFHDVHLQSNLDVARLLNSLEVDIVVDLNGHTNGARHEILSYRPCPLQVNYLGYPGTMASDFIDYIIADAIVLPTEHAAFFTEKIVHLPDCYLVNNSKRAISTVTPTRQEAGLPEAGFVFCCFNNNWKITAPMFDIWMRLLGSVPDSVLWLAQDNPETRKNLLAAAAVRGVDHQRLIFSPRVDKMEDHLARHRLADLFLDTLPYNAHSTASDALWAGLPVLTCRGSTFAGRVAASLLHGIGMPELVTDSPQEYEELACKLARDWELLHSLRSRLQQKRLTQPLFDTDRFRRSIEKAYTTMWEISQRGDVPKAFAVDPGLCRDTR